MFLGQINTVFHFINLEYLEVFSNSYVTLVIQYQALVENCCSFVAQEWATVKSVQAVLKVLPLALAGNRNQFECRIAFLEILCK